MKQISLSQTTSTMHRFFCFHQPDQKTKRSFQSGPGNLFLIEMPLYTEISTSSNNPEWNAQAPGPLALRVEGALLVHPLRYVVHVRDVRALLRVWVDAHVHQVPQLQNNKTKHLTPHPDSARQAQCYVCVTQCDKWKQLLPSSVHTENWSSSRSK